MEQAKPGAEAAKGAEAKPAEGSAKAGGLGAWLPLIVSAVLMPVLAYAMTTFVMVPKIKKSLGGEAVESAHAKEPAAKGASSAHGEAAGAKKEGEGKGHEAAGGESKGHESKGGGSSSKKVLVPMEKVIATVAKSQGGRYLLVKMTLVGNNEAFRDKVEENHDELMDAALTALSAKTLNDLEKPGDRNLLRSELIATFNSVLGADAVQEIYFTEFNIQ